MATRRSVPSARSAAVAGFLALVLLVGLVVWGGTRLIGNSGDESVTDETPASETEAAGETGVDEPAGSDDPVVGDNEDPEGGEALSETEGSEGDAESGTVRDGEHSGFVTAFTVDTITVDPAEFLTGDDALEAAREDGAVGPGDDLPNDFYIRYLGTGTLGLPVAADFEASLLDNVDLSQSRTLDAESVAALYSGELDAPWMYGPLEMLPVVLHVEDGEVTRAAQQYVP